MSRKEAKVSVTIENSIPLFERICDSVENTLEVSVTFEASIAEEKTANPIRKEYPGQIDFVWQ